MKAETTAYLHLILTKDWLPNGHFWPDTAREIMVVFHNNGYGLFLCVLSSISDTEPGCTIVHNLP